MSIIMTRSPRDLACEFREALSNLAAPGAEALAAIRDRYTPFTVEALEPLTGFQVDG